MYRLTSDGRRFKRHCDYVHKVAEDIIAKRRQEIVSTLQQHVTLYIMWPLGHHISKKWLNFRLYSFYNDKETSYLTYINLAH